MSTRPRTSFTLKTKIPCENCANAIKKSLAPLAGIKTVHCDTSASQITVETTDCTENVEAVKRSVIECLTKTGRVIYE